MPERKLPPPRESYTLLIERRLDWSELDSLGHANNARYFTWFEEARMAYFQRVGIPTSSHLGWGPILAHTDCHFLAPVTWPSVVSLGAKVTKLGNSSLTMQYAVYDESHHIERESKSRCVAHGSGVIVLVDYERNEKRVINNEIRAAIRALDQ